jgi:hypothetical protein
MKLISTDNQMEKDKLNERYRIYSKHDALSAKLNLADNKFQPYKAIIQLYRAFDGEWQ